MFSAQVFSALLAVAAPLLVSAEVVPSAPGPGDVFKVGETCSTVWTGDSVSTTNWKDMSIELMTGSNLAMVHLTTIKSGLDGTVDGKFEFDCPEVTPFSAIYFYQFSSTHVSNVTWTTRFTIASASGETVPPPNATQPGADGTSENIPWGIGALADPSKAVAAPLRGTASDAVANNDSSSSSSSSSAPAAGSANTGAAQTSQPSSKTSSSTPAASQTNNASNATTSNQPSGAVSVSSNVALLMSGMAVVLTIFMC
ncbi:hypothetical protein D9613_010031 [Agrocybe pediades]|uniref:Uncharacterized protein n=1 Tax=Agrocybe pediades TaxID=84607 RepID=A0A8H4QW38_9AGAR|nr:hypothetical protein D9613_010031 [Agrocybe pediades]